MGQVTEARRTGDVDKSKALLAEVFKLLGNSALERQTKVIYTKDEKVVDRALRSAYYFDLNKIGQAYELESRKLRITIRRPFQVGIALYQLAKLRMLEFYYDFLDRYFDRKDFELIQMDTDSNYMAISCERLEDIVRTDLKSEFEAQKNVGWLRTSGAVGPQVSSSLSARAAGLLRSARSVISSTKQRVKKKKFSTKGMSKKQNEITWQRFKSAFF